MDRKAVFWCEDQGDLAFYQGSNPVDETVAFLSAGDMVKFETLQTRRMRKALRCVAPT